MNSIILIILFLLNIAFLFLQIIIKILIFAKEFSFSFFTMIIGFIIYWIKCKVNQSLILIIY